MYTCRDQLIIWNIGHQYFIFSIFLNEGKKPNFTVVRLKKNLILFSCLLLRKKAHFLQHKGILMNAKSIFHIAE